MLIKNKSKKHSELFKNTLIWKDSVSFIKWNTFRRLFIFLSYSLPFNSFSSISYSFFLIDFVTLDMCFYDDDNNKIYTIIISIIIIIIYLLVRY